MKRAEAITRETKAEVNNFSKLTRDLRERNPYTLQYLKIESENPD